MRWGPYTHSHRHAFTDCLTLLIEPFIVKKGTLRHQTRWGNSDCDEKAASRSIPRKRELMLSSRACFATVDHAPIDLPEQVLIMIVSRVRDVRPATAEADARSLCADVLRGIGSVSRLWRRLAKGVLMGESRETSWPG